MLATVPAEKIDIAAMCQLLQELFSLEADFQPDEDRQRRGLEYIIDHPACGQLLVLKKDDEIIGMVNLLFTFSTAMGAPTVLMEDLVIKAERRRQGMGKFLLSQVIKLCRERGYERITLLADKDNQTARAFYQEQGFTESNMECWRYFP